MMNLSASSQTVPGSGNIDFSQQQSVVVAIVAVVRCVVLIASKVTVICRGAFAWPQVFQEVLGELAFRARKWE